MHRRGLVAAFALGALVAGERRAWAQACCASTSAIFPARLADDENGLAALAVKGAAAFGSFDGGRVLHGEPAGAGEIDLGQTLLVTGRVGGEPLQINIAVPFVETYRSLPPSTDFGGGVGDVSFSMRWDVLETGRDPVVPGIAPQLTLTLPSGTPVDTASGPLGAAATGLGSAQLGGGVSLEKTFRRALFAFTGTASFRGARTVHGIHSQLGPELAATVGASYTFRSGLSLGGSVTYSGSFDSSIDGAGVPESARALTQLAVIGALPLGGGSRLLGSLFFVPPISGVGQNEIGTVGLSLTFVYGLAKRDSCRACAKGVCHPAR